MRLNSKMAGKTDGRDAARDQQVWLMGNRHSSVDRSIEWDDPLPNLSDADVLIVDLTTLTEQVLERVDKPKLDQAQKLLKNKLINNGIIIIITQPIFSTKPASTSNASSPSPRYSNYHIFPFSLKTVPVPDGTRITPDDSHNFKTYIDSIEKYYFYIEKWDLKIDLGLPASFPNPDLVAVEGQGIRDHSNNDLGSTLAVARLRYGVHCDLPSTGHLVLLPPPTEEMGVAIGRILSALGKTTLQAETPPAWAKQMSLGRAGEYGAKAAELKTSVAKTQVEIGRLERKEAKILAHRRLLYAKGPELEDAVVKGFKAIGFTDIKPLGGADEEDAAFSMDSVTGYSRGAIEAKGLDKGIQVQHILQTKKWANQRAITDGGPSKGILVPNQHRMQPYPESRKDRMRIEHNQQVQAERDDICIIPSCALFEAVKRVLGGEKLDRAKIAAKIAAARGVLEDVL